MTECGSLREAKALRKRLTNSVSSPPMPSDSIEKLSAKTFFFCNLVERSLTCCYPLAKASITVSFPTKTSPYSPPSTRSTVSTMGILAKFTTKTCYTPR